MSPYIETYPPPHLPAWGHMRDTAAPSSGGQGHDSLPPCWSSGLPQGLGSGSWLLTRRPQPVPLSRMHDASSRPKREHKPRPREPLDLGEPEQSNGGFSCTSSGTKIAGNLGGGRPRSSTPASTWAGPRHPTLPACICKSSYPPSLVVFPVQRQTCSDPKQEHA